MTGLDRLKEIAKSTNDFVISRCIALEMEIAGICDQIERETAHDPAKDTTMSAYDLLPRDEREAIAWVREHGGVDAVRRDFQDADNQRVELCVSLDIDLETGWADAMVAMRRRLMPEGMEWPRFETGEPVRIGDEFTDGLGGTLVCTSVEFLACEEGVRDVLIHWDGDDPDNAMLVCMASGERVKRTAPKVLDADGVEIRVGEKLYDVETGCKRTVRAVNNNGTIEFDGCANRGWFAKFFTHRAPVLASDGEPLEVGQTVYAKNYGYVKCTVLAIEWVVDGYLVEVENEGGHKFRQTPDEFTHQRPVLDADGAEIREKCDVWWICEGDERGVHAERLRVETICPNGLIKCSPYNGGTWVYLEPYELYVNKPVPSSDGRPLREGDTVYKVGGDGTAYVFDGMSDNVDGLAMLHHDGKPYIGTGLRVDQLTHEQPDSWDALFADAVKGPCAYFYQVENGCDGCDAESEGSCIDVMFKDLVRRAKKLAGVEQ